MLMMDERTRKNYLRIYYKSLFPIEKLNLWLTYGKTTKLEMREFVFVSLYEDYFRYQSLLSTKILLNRLLFLIPNKVDIGAVWNQRPLYGNRTKIFPVLKELVFDIDLTDYDYIRICCQGRAICPKCWKYMAIACKIIHASLIEDWGYNIILWNYSGGRGIHAWICDQEALELESEQRRMIAGFFRMVFTGDQGKGRVKLDMISPYVERALKIIDEYFVPFCVVEQDMLGTAERMKKFIWLLYDPVTKKEVDDLLTQYHTSKKRWQAFLDYFQAKKKAGKLSEKYKYFIEEVKLVYCYPRIDYNVTVTVNHLLKSPFSIHPRTSLIAVPFDPKKVDSFDLNKVPSLWQVVSEFLALKRSDSDANSRGKRRKKEWYGFETSLADYLKVFDDFLLDLYYSRNPSRRE